MTQTAAQSIRDFRDAEGKRIQPYYAAYMIEHGFSTPAEAMAKTSRFGTSNHDYMRWNGQRWREFERETGRPEGGHFRRAYAAEFTDWLQARCDRLAAKETTDAA